MATVAEPIPQEHVRHTKTRANFVEKSDTGRSFAENAEEQIVRKKMVTNVVTPNRMANNIGMLSNAAVGETEDSMIWSQQPVTLQRKTPLSPMTAYAYPVYATRFSQHWMLSTLGKRAWARSNSRSILELRGTHSPLGHTRCTRHSPLGHTRCTRHSPLGHTRCTRHSPQRHPSAHKERQAGCLQRSGDPLSRLHQPPASIRDMLQKF